MFKRIRIAGLLAGLGVLSTWGVVGSARAESDGSILDREIQKLRYDYSLPVLASNDGLTAEQEDQLTLNDLAMADVKPPTYKSPGKAFLYSLAVPGLGQYYSGSKIKPFIFLAVEVFGLTQAFKYHGNGEDMTADYEKFNRDHWNRPEVLYEFGDDSLNAYQVYLMDAYGTLRPDTLDDPEDRRGFTHILPSEKNQQYYEMTGKYNQFAWGWDDAWLGDSTQGLAYWLADEGGVPRAIGTNIPTSANRLKYEDMRDDANNEYDKAMKMVFVVMGNHLVSAFEAFFATKRHNNRLKYNEPFSGIKVKPSLRSYSSWKDTPYVTFSYKF